MRAPVRRKIASLLGRCAATPDLRGLAAISTIIGSQRPAVAVEAAAKAFRGLPFARMGAADWATNADTGLNAHVVAVAPGQCDAFITHSWSDDGATKWERLLGWRDDFARETGHANPIVWLGARAPPCPAPKLHLARCR